MADDYRWMPWESLGGPISSAPAVVATGFGQMQVFARGPSGEVMNRVFADGWGAWRSLGASIIGAPAATSRRAGAADVFARDETGRVLHMVLEGGGPGVWQRTSVIAPSDFQAVATTPARVDLLGREASGRIWHHVFTLRE